MDPHLPVIPCSATFTIFPATFAPSRALLWELGISGHINLFAKMIVPFCESSCDPDHFIKEDHVRQFEELFIFFFMKEDLYRSRRILNSSILWPFVLVLTSRTIPITETGSLVSRFLFFRPGVKIPYRHNLFNYDM